MKFQQSHLFLDIFGIKKKYILESNEQIINNSSVFFEIDSLTSFGEDNSQKPKLFFVYFVLRKSKIQFDNYGLFAAKWREKKKKSMWVELDCRCNKITIYIEYKRVGYRKEKE